MPIAYAKTPEARAEEQRLLYVAITRAEEELRLHWSRTRVQGGEARERNPSPWLAPIEAALLDLQVASRPVDGRPHLTAPRADLHAHHPDVDAAPDDAGRPPRGVAGPGRPGGPGGAGGRARRPDPQGHRRHPTRSPEELGAVPGLGPVKAARFADALLAALDPDG